MLIKRQIEPIVNRLVQQYPVVTITGPRQSGKTVLCRSLFADKPYISLENPSTRLRATTDPNAFLETVKHGTVLDEIQRVPELFSYMQEYIDHQNKPGMYILTGSAQFELMQNIKQTLAGRTALVKLLPFSCKEIYSRESFPDIDTLLHTGFYPRIFDMKLNPTEALEYYTATYLERDVRELINVHDIHTFSIFLKLCAGRCAQLLNSTSLGNDCGVSSNTVISWLSVLEMSYIVFTLKPYYRNFNKRLIKSPKIYFFDCGLASYLIDIKELSHITIHPLRGSLFENFVVAELFKQAFNNNQQPNCYFWRDNTGHEIDLILEFGDTLLPIEIKSGKTINTDFFKNLNYFRKINPACTKCALVYGGNETFSQNDTWVVSYKDISLFENLDYRLNLEI